MTEYRQNAAFGPSDTLWDQAYLALEAAQVFATRQLPTDHEEVSIVLIESKEVLQALVEHVVSKLINHRALVMGEYKELF